MDSALPPGWEKDSATLYLHETGVRIEKRVYREQEGWILVPVDLDTPVTSFTPDKDGLAQAFAAWQKGAAKVKVKAVPTKAALLKAKAKAKKKAEEEEAEAREEAADGEDGEGKAAKDDEGDDD